MQTRALKTLIEITRVGSFATAAEQRGMTLSAVSMQIKSLETELGVLLFDRTFRPPKLTVLGRTVCEHAEAIIAAENRVVDVCRPTNKLVGKFRLGFIPTASVRFLPDFLIKAKATTPDAHFDIETGLSEMLETRVLAGLLDAAVVTATPMSNPGLQYKLLHRENLIYAAPREAQHLAPDKLIQTLPFFHFMPLSGIGKLIATHTQSFKNQGRKSIVLDSVEAIMECVNRGIGFTLLPEPDIERYLTKNALIMQHNDRKMTLDMVLVTSKKHGNSTQMKIIDSMLTS